MRKRAYDINVTEFIELEPYGDVRLEGTVEVFRDDDDCLAIDGIDVAVFSDTGDDLVDELLGNLHDKLTMEHYQKICIFLQNRLEKFARDEVPTRSEIAAMAAEDAYDAWKEEQWGL